MSGEAVGRYLAERGIAFAVIGAQAMMLRGDVQELWRGMRDLQ